jgi:DNA-directed RNA polymerase subunit RPC12/RpoP
VTVYACPNCSAVLEPMSRAHGCEFTGCRCNICGYREEVADDTPVGSALDTDEGLWQTCQIECDVCRKEWTATFPIEAPGLECPQCSHMNAIPCPSNPDDGT